MNNFLLALQYQKTIMETHKSVGTGLMRLVINVSCGYYQIKDIGAIINFFFLCLKSNKLGSESESNMAKLIEILKTRDPQAKAASSFLNPDPDTVSVQSGKESSLGRTATKSSIYLNFFYMKIISFFF